MQQENIERWKLKRLLKFLDSCKGNGTSVVSLVLPPGEQISRASDMMSKEIGSAECIKSRVNRLSVLGALSSCIQKLKLYTKVPENGLVIYSGTAVLPDGKEKKLSLDIIPFKPISQKMYICDDSFRTECLSQLLQDSEIYGFIILDGNGALFATLSGSRKEVLHEFSVDLPKKHGRGGQSALRFERLRNEKRHNYLRKVSEAAVTCFLTQDKPNISGLILAGSAEFKNNLNCSDMFDQRLKNIVLQIFDTSYGSDNGLNQAIEMSSEILRNTKFVQEKKLLSEFFRHISCDTGKICFGVKETMFCLENGAVETLIVYENLEKQLDETKQKEKSSDSLLDWLVENYNSFGCKLEFCSDKTSEGNQFILGFGGIAGILRYKVEFDYDEENTKQTSGESLECETKDDWDFI